jgi:hypothetical protein
MVTVTVISAKMNQLIEISRIQGHDQLTKLPGRAMGTEPTEKI